MTTETDERHAVSDERDSGGSADAVTDAVTDTDDADQDRGRTAVATQPLRPSGKRSKRGAAAGVTDAVTEPDAAAEEVSKNGGGKAKTAKKGKRPGKGGRNPFAFVLNYLKQVVAELRKVIWPNRKQMVSYTTVVLIFLAFMVALIGLSDLGLSRLVSLVFG